MPRLKLRRWLVNIGCITAIVLILVQIQLTFLSGYSRVNVEHKVETTDNMGYFLTTFQSPEASRQEGDAMDQEIGGSTWKGRLWFFTNGTVRPKKASRPEVYPCLFYEDCLKYKRQDRRNMDRIVRQMTYVPPTYNNLTRIKTILMANGLGGWGGVPLGRKAFTKLSNCPVNTCTLVLDKKKYKQTADAVLFKHFFTLPTNPKPSHQKWIMYILESPKNTPDYEKIGENIIDWTASYRHDSDIVTPYEKFEPFDKEDPRRIKAELFNKACNRAENKTKKVAWFVSNCSPQHRLNYARELSKHIHVDIYGYCGTKQCARGSSNECFDLLNKNYKFYLAFENSNCKDYVTEKFFLNGLSNDIIPIVMGAHPDDYLRQAPPHSYIHVEDFASPEHLAEYLHVLDKDDEKYNEYFRWKGTGEFINTHFWCRVCALLNAPQDHLPHRTHKNIQTWWRGGDVCVPTVWRPSTFRSLHTLKPSNYH